MKPGILKRKKRERGPEESAPSGKQKRTRILSRGRAPTLNETLPRIDEICQQQESMIPIKNEAGYDREDGIRFDREPADEMEKLLMRWAKHLDHDGSTYEECPNCHKYNMIETRYTSNQVVFICQGCQKRFSLQR